jgi:hypothetical protein
MATSVSAPVVRGFCRPRRALNLENKNSCESRQRAQALDKFPSAGGLSKVPSGCFSAGLLKVCLTAETPEIRSPFGPHYSHAVFPH